MEKKIKAMKAASVCLYILTFVLMVVAACCFALSNKIYFLFAALALASLVCGFIITDKRQDLEPAKEVTAQAEAKVSQKPKALIVMCVAFVLVFLFGFIAKCFETSGFSVKVSDFTLTKEMTLSYNGGEINGKSFAMKNDTSYSVTMYVPSTATEANPAPTVFVLPGFTRTKATMSQYCIELSRRGAVVFCLDPGGQGGTTETSTTGANGIEFLVQYVYNNTDDFKFVDRSRFGAVGHSAGGGNVCTLAADMAFGSYEQSIIKAVYISGYIKVSSANKYANLRSNAALSYAYYDEGAFRYQTDTSSFEIITRRFLNEVNNSKNSIDDVIYDYGYGDIANGTYRIIHRENINHCFEMYDGISIANTIDFFNETLAMGSPLKGTCQTWLGKEICNGLALAAAFTFVIALCAVLVKLPFFASMKEAQNKVRVLPDPNVRKSVVHKVILWFSMIVTAVIACLDYIPLANYSIKIFPTGNSSSVYTFVFPARMINAILLWAVINGAIGLVIFFGTTIAEYFIEKARAKAKGVQMEEFDWGKFRTVKICSGKSNALINTLKALLMSLIMFCSFYLLVLVSYVLLHQDFRFMLISAAPINARMFVTAIEYIPLIFVFYISNSIRVNCSIGRENWKEWKIQLVGALANSIGLAFILLINYVCFFTQGAPFYGYWGNGTEIWLYVNMVFALVVMMFILPIFNRLLYKITGNVWTGALGWCMIFIMMTISASVSYIPMY